MAKPNGHGYRGVAADWSAGNLRYKDTSGNVIFTIDATNRKVTFPSGSSLDTSASNVSTGVPTAEAYSATVTIDSTKRKHRIAGLNGTSATSTFNASTTGADGDEMRIEVTSDAGGTCTITFGTNFKTGATLAVTASHYAVVNFMSDGTNWKEQSRSTIITS